MRALKRRLAGEEGATLVMVALSLLVLLLFLALSIDGALGYVERRRVQNAADAGSLAAIQVLATGGTDAQIRAAVNEYTTVQNEADSFRAFYIRLAGGPSVGTVGAGSIPVDTTGVRAIAQGTIPTFFGGLTGHHSFEAEATGAGGLGLLDVVMVLDESGSMDDDSCDLRENQCPSSDPHDVPTCNQCRGNWNSSTGCDINPAQLFSGHSCTLTTQVGCQNCRGVWRNPPMPITDVRSTASSFVTYFNSNLTRMAVVSYSSNATLDRQLTNNLAAVQATIGGVGAPYPSGCTNIQAGVRSAINELTGPRRRDALRFIVFLTDGLPNQWVGGGCSGCPSDPGACPTAITRAIQEAQAAAGSAIIMYTIGLGNHVDNAMLASMAAATGGEYFHAPSTADLPAIYQTIFERITLHLVE